jgi:hypothetical protein
VADIWIGLAGGEAVEPLDDDTGGAFVHVLAPAADEDELRAAARDALSAAGFRLTELDDAEPVRERLRRGSLAPDLLELALDAALHGSTQLGAFFTYPAEEAEEPDETARALRALREEGTLVNVRCFGDQHSALGYVADVGADWALLQIIDSRGEADGFRALRINTVAEIDDVDPDHSLLPRVLAQRPVAVSLPEVGLEDTRALLTGAGLQSALVYLVSENLDADAFWIGQIAALDDDGVVLRKVSPLGKWDGEVRYAYETITGVGFGGGYEEALAIAVGAARVSG